MKKTKDKLYVIRKYVKAKSASQAIRLDKTTPVDDVYIENNFSENHLVDAIGFSMQEEEDDE